MSKLTVLRGKGAERDVEVLFWPKEPFIPENSLVIQIFHRENVFGTQTKECAGGYLSSHSKCH